MGDGLKLGSWQRIDLIHRLPKSRFSCAAKSLLISLAKHESRRNGVCFASMSTLARETSLSREWVCKLYDQLEESGVLLVLEKQVGRPRTVQIDWEAVEAATCEAGSQVLTTRFGPTCEQLHSPPVKPMPEPDNSLMPACELSSHKGFEGSEGEKERASSDEDVQTLPVRRSARTEAGQISDEELEERQRVAAEARQNLPDWMIQSSRQTRP